MKKILLITIFVMAFFPWKSFAQVAPCSATLSVDVTAATQNGGNGITFSQVAGEIIADLVRGKKNKDATLFSFNR